MPTDSPTLEEIEVMSITSLSSGGRKRPLTKHPRSRETRSETIELIHKPSGRTRTVQIPPGNYTRRDLQRLRRQAKQEFLKQLSGKTIGLEDAIKRVLLDWHPYPGLSTDMEDPELDGEVRSVYRQIDRISSAADAAHVIARVFASSFGDNARFSPDACREVGAALYAILSERGSLK